MTTVRYTPLTSYHEYPLGEMRRRASRFLTAMRRRRTVRDFSDRPVPRDIVQSCIQTAAAAPSGNNDQPWQFVAVNHPQIKERICEAAEAVEREFYSQASTRPWVQALEHLGTGPHKPFLKMAPWLIVIFAERYGLNADGGKRKFYYIQESVGIATGMLISAVHNAGLVCLTYTPSRMGFLNRILQRPAREKPFMILVVGYPADQAQVPVVPKRTLEQVVTFI